jgi:hypothetical protein
MAYLVSLGCKRICCKLRKKVSRLYHAKLFKLRTYFQFPANPTPCVYSIYPVREAYMPPLPAPPGLKSGAPEISGQGCSEIFLPPLPAPPGLHLSCSGHTLQVRRSPASRRSIRTTRGSPDASPHPLQFLLGVDHGSSMELRWRA